jgi:hypothetical protein
MKKSVRFSIHCINNSVFSLAKYNEVQILIIKFMKENSDVVV